MKYYTLGAIPAIGVSIYMLFRDYLGNYNSKTKFSTNCFVSGETFIKNSKNEYYSIMNIDNTPFGDKYFISSDKFDEKMIKQWEFKNKKHSIAKLIFENDKSYFVESNQDINVENPKIQLLTDDEIKKLMKNPPKFIPLPKKY